MPARGGLVRGAERGRGVRLAAHDGAPRTRPHPRSDGGARCRSTPRRSSVLPGAGVAPAPEQELIARDADADVDRAAHAVLDRLSTASARSSPCTRAEQAAADRHPSRPHAADGQAPAREDHDRRARRARAPRRAWLRARRAAGRAAGVRARQPARGGPGADPPGGLRRSARCSTSASTYGASGSPRWSRSPRSNPPVPASSTGRCSAPAKRPRASSNTRAPPTRAPSIRRRSPGRVQAPPSPRSPAAWRSAAAPRTASPRTSTRSAAWRRSSARRANTNRNGTSRAGSASRRRAP